MGDSMNSYEIQDAVIAICNERHIPITHDIGKKHYESDSPTMKQKMDIRREIEDREMLKGLEVAQ